MHGFIGCFDGWHHFNENFLMSKRWYMYVDLFTSTYDLCTMIYLLQLSRTVTYVLWLDHSLDISMISSLVYNLTEFYLAFCWFQYMLMYIVLN